MFMLILMLVGNSLEIGCKMKIGFFVREIREFEKKLQVIPASEASCGMGYGGWVLVSCISYLLPGGWT